MSDARDVIASRTYEREKGGRVHVSIYHPHPSGTGDTHLCAYRIEGLDGGPTDGDVEGSDGLQCLQLVTLSIRRQLERVAPHLRWAGGEQGDLGLPHSVPTIFGREFSERLERMMAEEIGKQAQQLGADR